VRKLTPTSYAILGLLGLRSWSAYELTKQGRRSLHFCWPRAETRIYQEPKNLVEHGLVKATTTAKGRRTRTEYAITAKGRKALRAWMGQPSAPPRLESEALLRLFFADHGTKAGTLANIDAIRTWADRRTVENIRIPRSYLDGDIAFPERLAQIVVVGRFLTDFTDMVRAWAEWAAAVVKTWPEQPTGAEPDWATIAEVASRPLPGAPAPASPRRR
jgi:DNA-binding PadR family transcriptional regulator